MQGMARFQFMLVKTNAVLYNGIRQLGGVPKWLKGLASNTSRSVTPTREFKSLHLRQSENPDTFVSGFSLLYLFNKYESISPMWSEKNIFKKHSKSIQDIICPKNDFTL